jgi:peroxiredoxin
LQDHLPQIEAAGARLVAVSADEQGDLDALRDRFALTFPILSDPEVKIAETYGVRQKDRDVALPSTFIVGADRVISFVHVAKNPVDRLSTADLLAALRKGR